ASGTAELLGIPGLTLAGTLSARQNTTGSDISRSISVGASHANSLFQQVRRQSPAHLRSVRVSQTLRAIS
ncbi:MAG UNVERIFIED_CONTAM: hypothetical protein LVR18_39960, partial [Planctomycetaceae bacterium]